MHKFPKLLPALLLLGLFLVPSTEARADAVVISSGFVTIGGPILSRGSYRSVNFNFGGNNFNARGQEGDGTTQRPLSPCTFGPCAAGTIVNGSSDTNLQGIGSATINGVSYGPTQYNFSPGSSFQFRTASLIIPPSDAASFELTTPFTMSGTLSVYYNDATAPGWNPAFITEVFGSGIATLFFTQHPPTGGYILSNIRYDFQPVPEPATLILLGTGMAGIAARVSRRRRRSKENS